MFKGVFQNGLRTGHFNESLSQKLIASMSEIMEYVECYISDEEINVDKKAINIKKRVSDVSDSSYQQRKSQYTSPVRDKASFKQSGLCCLYRDMYKTNIMRRKLNRWSKYHKMRGHHTNHYYERKK